MGSSLEARRYEGVNFLNYLTVVGSQIFGYTATFVGTVADSHLWSATLNARLSENGTDKYSQSITMSGPAAFFNSQLYPFDPLKDYLQPAYHQLASACFEDGKLVSATKPVPTLLTVNPTVLYRGMTQNVSFRGITMEGVQQAYLGTSLALPTTVTSATSFAAGVTISIPQSAASGQQYITLLENLDGVATFTNSAVTVAVADPTPVLTSLTPSSGVQGTTVQATITGNYLGGNPTPCIIVGGNCLGSYNGVTVVSWGCNCTNPINATLNVTLTIAADAPVGSVPIGIRSNGGSFNSSFAPGPAGGSQPLSQTLAFQVQATSPLCTSVQIREETVSPSTSSIAGFYDAVAVQEIPPYNPASLRVGLQSTFEVVRMPPNCPVEWHVSGDAIIIGTPYDPTVTLKGTEVGSAFVSVLGTIALVAASTNVPVRLERTPTIPIRVRILTTDAGTNPAATIAIVNRDIATANLLWSQAALKFELVETVNYASSAFLNPSSDQERIQLFDVLKNTGGFEIYYVNTCPDRPELVGAATSEGIVDCQGNRPSLSNSSKRRTIAHELGHSMNLTHSGSNILHLMSEDPGDVAGDIRASEVETIYRFQYFYHN